MLMMSQLLYDDDDVTIHSCVINIRTDEFCVRPGLCEFSEAVSGSPNFHLPFDYIHYQSLTDNEQEFTVSLLTYTNISYGNIVAGEHTTSKCHYKQ